MKRASTVYLAVALGACSLGSTAGHAAARLPAGTFNYVVRGQICALGNCTSAAAPGRIIVAGSGKISVFFATPDQTSLQANGVVLQLGRTVNLSGRGRLPDTIFGGLVPQGGSGSASFDGKRLALSVVLTGSGPLNGGNATVSARFSNTFEIDASTGALLRGTGSAQGTIQGQAANGQPFSGPVTGSSTIEMK